MTAGRAVRAAAERLAQSSDTARLDAELLMAHALGVTRSDLLLRHMDGPVPAGFDALVARRSAHEPVAYILGVQEFFGREFVVTPDVLIPRGDSETVVEAALAHCGPGARVLDLGTGSGALLLTLLAERDSVCGAGIDCSAAALATARRNADALGLSARAEFFHRSWHRAGWSQDMGQFDIVIANPPYVETDASLAPSVTQFEPHGALFAGPDGLDEYRILIPQLPALMKEGGAAVLEIGHRQADMVGKIAQESGFSAAMHRDLGHRPRALILTL